MGHQSKLGGFGSMASATASWPGTLMPHQGDHFVGHRGVCIGRPEGSAGILDGPTILVGDGIHRRWCLRPDWHQQFPGGHAARRIGAKRIFGLRGDWPHTFQITARLCLGIGNAGGAVPGAPRTLGTGYVDPVSVARFSLERWNSNHPGHRRRPFPSEQNAGDRGAAQCPHFKAPEFFGDRGDVCHPSAIEWAHCPAPQSPIWNLRIVRRGQRRIQFRFTGIESSSGTIGRKNLVEQLGGTRLTRFQKLRPNNHDNSVP
jgi:hypothetical protein